MLMSPEYFATTDFYESTIPRIDPEIKARWIAELRSGKHKQAKYMLKDPSNGGLCCLGVYCEMLELPESIVEKHIDRLDGEGSSREPVVVFGSGDNDATRSWLIIPANFGIPFVELDMPSYDSKFLGNRPLFRCAARPVEGYETFRNALDEVDYGLPTLNDSGFTFDQIADVINYFL